MLRVPMLHGAHRPSACLVICVNPFVFLILRVSPLRGATLLLLVLVVVVVGVFGVFVLIRLLLCSSNLCIVHILMCISDWWLFGLFCRFC